MLFRSFVSIIIKACWVILFKADSVYQFTKEIYGVMSEVSAHKITKEKKKRHYKQITSHHIRVHHRSAITLHQTNMTFIINDITVNLALQEQYTVVRKEQFSFALDVCCILNCEASL